jgi:hypothetical protein
MTGARVTIGVPTYNSVSAKFAYDLAKLTGFTSATILGAGQPLAALTLVFKDGTLICPQRYVIVKMAQRFGATHLFWLDGDMRFPRDTLVRLLAHNQPIVGANYCGRRQPSGPTAFRWPTPSAPVLVDTLPESAGLEPVDSLGFGCCLMQMDVFAKTAEPWFPLQWSKYTTTDGFFEMRGEDIGFCGLAKDAGFQPYIDHDLSHDVRHVGEHEYSPEDALEMREALLASDSRFAPPPPANLVVLP